MTDALSIALFPIKLCFEFYFSKSMADEQRHAHQVWILGENVLVETIFRSRMLSSSVCVCCLHVKNVLTG